VEDQLVGDEGLLGDGGGLGPAQERDDGRAVRGVPVGEPVVGTCSETRGPSSTRATALARRIG
jgi:hypothetical protein